MSDLAVVYAEAFGQFQYPSAPLHPDHRHLQQADTSLTTFLLSQNW